MLHNPKWDEGLLDLSKPSLRALSHILRHKELWPEGFRWDYRVCNNCAMGMAHKLWGVALQCKSLFPVLGIPKAEALDIFAGINNYGGPWKVFFKNEVTPEMVADQIDLHLAKSA